MVLDYMSDTGLQERVLLDMEGIDPQCSLGPPYGSSLYLYLDERIHRTKGTAPFPLQVLLDEDRNIRAFTTEHAAEDLVDLIEDMIDE